MLEVGNFLVGQGICLRDNWDQIDFSMKSAHDLYIQGLERVTGRLNKVDTGVHSVIHNVHSIYLVLRVEIGIESLLNVFDYGTPGVIVIYEIAKTRRIDDR